jgi:hypothetical protein
MRLSSVKPTGETLIAAVISGRVLISVTTLTRRSASSEKSLHLNLISSQGDACVTCRPFMLRVMSRIGGKE